MITSLNRLCIDPVILRVRAYEAHVDHTVRIVDPHHQPVLVPGDVEYRPPVAQYAGRTELALELRGRAPLRLEHMPVPRQHRLAGIGIRRLALPERAQGGQGYDAHGVA